MPMDEEADHTEEPTGDSPEPSVANKKGEEEAQDHPRGDNESPDSASTEEEDPQEEPEEAPETTTEGSDSQQEREELLEKFSQMEERIDELETLLEDFQRRNEHEHKELKQYAVKDFAEDMLEVKDSLQDAIEMEDLEDGTEQRLRVVVRQFDSIFTAGRIEKIEPEVGESFDDNLHRMVDKRPSESLETETIVEVVESGYVMSDRLLRPSRVIVAE